MIDSNEFESPNDDHQNIIEDQNHCCLCGSKLSFKHQIDYHSLQVREDADCPSCKIQLKSKQFGLH